MPRPPSSPLHPVACEGEHCDALVWFKSVRLATSPKLKLLPLLPQPSDTGSVAARPFSTEPGRFLAKGEALAEGESRWTNHLDDCPDADSFRRKAQRETWRRAQSAAGRDRRNRRGKRPSRQAAAIEQPGLFQIPGGEK